MKKSAILRVGLFILIVLVLCLVLFMTRYNAGSWNDASRFAAIENMVDRDTFSITESIFFTGDKIQVDGVFYSDKPPLFSLYAATPHFIIHGFFGISFPQYPRIIVYITNIFSLFIPFIFYFGALYVCSKKYFEGKKEHIGFIVVLLAIGTALFPYVGQLNNHLPAAVLVGIVSLFLYFKEKISFHNAFWLGFCLSLATTFDMGAGFIALLSTLFLVHILYTAGTSWKAKRGILFSYIGGALIPLIQHIFVNVQITGDILPGSLHPEFFSWDGTEFDLYNLTGASFAINSIKEWFQYLWYMVGFGYKGMLLHSPIIGLGIFISVKKLFSKKGKKKVYMLYALLSFLSIVLYYSFFGKGGGGASYTVRWLLIFFPIFFPILVEWSIKSRERLFVCILLTAIPAIWNIAALGNVMGAPYHVDNYGLINALVGLPDYILPRIQSLLQMVN